tara:strand:- start:5201 stop:7144 length:1944 start_codon:yes stop_codon:yes gene_type:complete
MDSGKVIYDVLKNDTDVSALVSSRIFPNVAKNTTEFPFIVYDVTGETPTQDNDGVSTLDTDGVMVSCYCKTYAQASDLAKKIRTSLDRRSGTYNGVVVQSIKYNGYNDLFDENVSDEGVYRKALDFDLRILNIDVFQNRLSAYFDGVDEYVDLGDVLNLGTADFSISAWVKTDNWDSFYIMSKAEDPENRWYFRGNDATPPRLHMYQVVDEVTHSTYTGSSIDLNDYENTWAHIVISADRDGKVVGYVNGVADTADINGEDTNLDNEGDLVISKFEFTNTFYSNGNIDEVAMWDSALTSDEVAALYNNGTPFNVLNNRGKYSSSGSVTVYLRMGDGQTFVGGFSLVENPGFEEAGSWTALDDTGVISERSTEKPQTGDYSWKLEVDGASINMGTFSAEMTVEPNTIYRASVWAYAPSANDNRWCVLSGEPTDAWDIVGGTVAYVGKTVPADTWTEIVGYFRTASTATTIQVRLRNGNSTGADGDLRYFDNVSIVKVTYEFLLLDSVNLTESANVLDATWANSVGGTWVIDGDTLTKADATVTDVRQTTPTIGGNFTYMELDYTINSYTSGDLAFRFGGGDNQDVQQIILGNHKIYIGNDGTVVPYNFQVKGSFIGSITINSLKTINGNPGLMINMDSDNIVTDVPLY